MGPAAHCPVLVVDDNAAMRESLRDMLEDEGHAVLLAENGQEALATVRSHPEVHVVLLDIMMPVMNGLEFLAAKVEDPSISSIPVVVMSAHLATVSQPAGANAVFAKPFDSAALLDKVSELC
jgi:CheY-like chemotaxis protein